MKTFILFAIAATALIGLASTPSIAAEHEQLFLAYACGTTLCSNEVELVPASGLTRRRTIQTSEYLNDASITFTAISGKRVAVIEWTTIPASGAASRQSWTYEIPGDSIPTTIWPETGTNREHDFMVIKGTGALAIAPLPPSPIDVKGFTKLIPAYSQPNEQIVGYADSR